MPILLVPLGFFFLFARDDQPIAVQTDLYVLLLDARKFSRHLYCVCRFGYVGGCREISAEPKEDKWLQFTNDNLADAWRGNIKYRSLLLGGYGGMKRIYPEYGF